MFSVRHGIMCLSGSMSLVICGGIGVCMFLFGWFILTDQL